MPSPQSQADHVCRLHAVLQDTQDTLLDHLEAVRIAHSTIIQLKSKCTAFDITMFRPLIFAALLASCVHAYPCLPEQYEMSVEGEEGIFCVDESPICIADISYGACPLASEALPAGSYCGLVATGVYGCKTGSDPAFLPMEVPDDNATEAPTGAPTEVPTEAPTEAPTETPTEAPTEAPMTNAPTAAPSTSSPGTSSATDGSQCVDGDYEMSVEGVAGIFCLSEGPICMADISTGTCPGPQNGLPFGSSCGRVASGVFGCKVNTGSETPAPGSTPLQTPEPTMPLQTPAPPSAPAGSCADGTPMSVEGVAPIFCVAEPACVADRGTGNCPGAQAGLPFGSYCEIITRTGAFGCKPFNGTNIKNNVVYPSVRNCTGNINGDAVVSVEKAGDFCASHPVCAGSIIGNCPRAQETLLQDSVCKTLRPNVYGCTY